MAGSKLSLGAILVDPGVRYRVWAPSRSVSVQVFPKDGGSMRRVALQPVESGFHEGIDPFGCAGDRYSFELAPDAVFPCPASRWQPDGVSGPSLVVDARQYSWTDRNWSRPPFRDLVIYELHVGTFTPAGTFRAVIERLPYLRNLGVNAIEPMPIADFPGERNWGYDGVRLFAPARIYGTPGDLRALVDAAHAHDIAVILDVVFNHFGPAGNFLREFSPAYFESRHRTPWGEAINFGADNCGPVRAYFRENLIYWMEEFHIDGFRLDATHAIFDDSPQHILTELAEVVHERGGYFIVEDERNESRLITAPEENGYGADAAWADDFHHTVDVALVDSSMYADRFTGGLSELVEVLQHGWVQLDPARAAMGPSRGTRCGHLAPERFIFCISNHDQAGNRAYGDRINHLVPPAAYRAASGLLCLSPYTPLLFMGQEWSASTPFLYFTDHHEELGQLVEKGRRSELRRFPAFKAAMAVRDIPSPQARETFEQSKLDWSEAEQAGHAGCLHLYRDALRLRREHRVFRPADRSTARAAALTCGVLALRYTDGMEDWLLLCDLRGRHSGSLDDEPFCAQPPGRAWRIEWSTNDPKFGGHEQNDHRIESGRLVFDHPETLLLRAH